MAPNEIEHDGGLRSVLATPQPRRRRAHAIAVGGAIAAHAVLVAILQLAGPAHVPRPATPLDVLVVDLVAPQPAEPPSPPSASEPDATRSEATPPRFNIVPQPPPAAEPPASDLAILSSPDSPAQAAALPDDVRLKCTLSRWEIDRNRPKRD